MLPSSRVAAALSCNGPHDELISLDRHDTIPLYFPFRPFSSNSSGSTS
jgi:hypothetical protein